MIDIKKIPQILRNIRIKKKMSLREMAEILGVSCATIHHWEQRRNLPNFVTLCTIINKLEDDPRLKNNSPPPSHTPLATESPPPELPVEVVVSQPTKG